MKNIAIITITLNIIAIAIIGQVLYDKGTERQTETCDKERGIFVPYRNDLQKYNQYPNE